MTTWPPLTHAPGTGFLQQLTPALVPNWYVASVHCCTLTPKYDIAISPLAAQHQTLVCWPSRVSEIRPMACAPAGAGRIAARIVNRTTTATEVSCFIVSSPPSGGPQLPTRPQLLKKPIVWVAVS